MVGRIKGVMVPGVLTPDRAKCKALKASAEPPATNTSLARPRRRGHASKPPSKEKSVMKAMVAAAAALLCAATPATAACQLYGGIGNGLTEGIAKFMAEAAVKNIIENKGLKPTGEIKHTCTAAALGTECTARQQGCK
ncbi:MAG: hypothetical protein B7Y80_06250 [Hyphomicrobium sp. 32-62-53]|nr:MAG: hypothetical protein B7Z29_11980 [Hyphomicrobium sp. 12-62-95]OYY00822.1 MAG: hypothetical protein B7Y80_06250 [Hyphomicrobium sp. 32-62-53]